MPGNSTPKTLFALAVSSGIWLHPGLTVTPAAADLPDVATIPNPKEEASFDDRFSKTDHSATEITNIAAWKHPAKTGFTRYGLHQTKVELMWSRKFPVFHIAQWTGGDPTNYAAHTSPDAAFFTPLPADLLTANARWPYRIIADDTRTGFVVDATMPSWCANGCNSQAAGSGCTSSRPTVRISTRSSGFGGSCTSI